MVEVRNSWERATHLDDKKIKSLICRMIGVMRNIQNRHKRIMQMNSFIIARLQRKLRKFFENPLSGSQFRVLESHL